MTWFIALSWALSLVLLLLSVRWGVTYWRQQVSPKLVVQAEQNLAELLIFMPAQQLVTGVLVGILLLTALLSLWMSVLTASLTGVLLLLVTPLIYRQIRAKRTYKIKHQLPSFLLQLSVALQSGLSLSAALTQLAKQQPAPLGAELRLMVRRQHVGSNLLAAAKDFAERVPLLSVRQFALVIELSDMHGAGQARVMAQLAHSLQQQLYARERMLSLSAQARLQGYVMGFLPLLLFAVLHWLEPENTGQLLYTEMGQIILILAACLLLCGALIVKRMLGQELNHDA
ncbi:type II secretion system F family protein [Pseudidiomarina taiwanensis]|uniref:Type II secretion system protein GspF domain-containing protein n=1 Tax=Pseudidiomarina taiwanensis TaxID=337250 RepID=A0A432ZC31_9GAMM|nr:type II secretion system F family protein [Pseudidiomarina taiwanensis]RUO75527.1 hypothetical protein CWI83_10375 [Pseudidiomarina taiwanensis]